MQIISEQMNQNLSRFLLKVLLCASFFYFSSFLAWTALSKIDFCYSYIYDVIDIKGMVEKYAPQNTDKSKIVFEETDKAEHVRLFSEINHAVNNGGVGLENIFFTPSSGGEPVKMLNEAEIQHLMDVSGIVFVFKTGAIFSALTGIFCFIIMLNTPRSSLRPLLLVFITALTLIVLSAIVYLVGSERVFYYLHDIIFKDHQWFFFYQESLMAVIMKAPVIFGYITVMLVVLSFAIYTALMLIIKFIFGFVKSY